jgi:hypothetical protein
MMLAASSTMHNRTVARKDIGWAEPFFFALRARFLCRRWMCKEFYASLLRFSATLGVAVGCEIVASAQASVQTSVQASMENLAEASVETFSRGFSLLGRETSIEFLEVLGGFSGGESRG